jgi:hypothetical protein
MSSPSVRSRREPSKIAQGKRSAALGKRQTEGIRPGGGGSNAPARIAESSDGRRLSHRPSGAEILGRTLLQGFTLGYFRLFPPGRTALNASLFPHLELLEHCSQIYETTFLFNDANATLRIDAAKLHGLGPAFSLNSSRPRAMAFASSSSHFGFFTIRRSAASMLACGNAFTISSIAPSITMLPARTLPNS